MSDICSGGTWAMVCVVHSDGMSSSSSGASSISSTKKRVNSGVIGRLETFQKCGPLRKMNDSRQLTADS